jgi:hypothetical protein
MKYPGHGSPRESTGMPACKVFLDTVCRNLLLSPYTTKIVKYENGKCKFFFVPHSATAARFAKQAQEKSTRIEKETLHEEAQ